MRRSLGWVVANLWLIMWGAGFLLIAFLALLTWTPSAHAVHTPGARSLTARAIPQAQEGPPYSLLDPAPTMSLSEIRCEAWQYENQNRACPDAATLQHFWPTVTQALKTLYVGLSVYCVGFLSADSFNVEYFSASRELVIHCFSAAPWLAFKSGASGVSALPDTELVLVPTDSIEPGTVTVVKDDRVEHLVGDDSQMTVLGTVAIS